MKFIILLDHIIKIGKPILDLESSIIYVGSNYQKNEVQTEWTYYYNADGEVDSATEMYTDTELSCDYSDTCTIVASEPTI